MKTETQETKKTYLLSDMYEQARRAYYSISFDPEKRAQQTVEGYSEQLEEDLKSIPEDQRERYTQNFRKYLGAWLSAMSRCLSSMITGPSNFPTRRNEKANNVEHRRYEEFTEWRERALKAIEKNRLANRTEGEVVNDQWKLVKKNILRSASTIIAIDLGQEVYTRSLFVNAITGSIRTLAKNGKTELVKLALDYIKELNRLAVEKGAKEIITAKNGIWELEQVAEAKREEKVDATVRENEIEEFSFPNSIGSFQVVKNYKLDRIQVIFPDKPKEEIREILKKEAALKWAPSEGAWQRQLTGNAEFAIKAMIDKFSKIETDEVGRIAVHG